MSRNSRGIAFVLVAALIGITVVSGALFFAVHTSQPLESDGGRLALVGTNAEQEQGGVRGLQPDASGVAPSAAALAAGSTAEGPHGKSNERKALVWRPKRVLPVGGQGAGAHAALRGHRPRVDPASEAPKPAEVVASPAPLEPADIIVLSMHSSGTSLLGGLLHASGAWMGRYGDLIWKQDHVPAECVKEQRTPEWQASDEAAIKRMGESPAALRALKVLERVKEAATRLKDAHVKKPVTLMSIVRAVRENDPALRGPPKTPVGTGPGAADCAAANVYNRKGFYELLELWRLDMTLLRDVEMEAKLFDTMYDLAGFEEVAHYYLGHETLRLVRRHLATLLTLMHATQPPGVPLVVKEPRMALTMKWLDDPAVPVMQSKDYAAPLPAVGWRRPVMLVVVRHPSLVVASLVKRDQRDPRVVAASWEVHMVHSLKSSSGHNRVIVDAEDMMASPSKFMELLCQVLGHAGAPGLRADAEEIRKIFDPSLVHQKAPSAADGAAAGEGDAAAAAKGVAEAAVSDAQHRLYAQLREHSLRLSQTADENWDRMARTNSQLNNLGVSDAASRTLCGGGYAKGYNRELFCVPGGFSGPQWLLDLEQHK